MCKPELTYNFVEVCKDIGDAWAEITYRITNKHNETIREFAEDEEVLAYSTWWSFLTKEEQERLIEYERECESDDHWNRVNN